jgi:PKD repeat protein
MDLPSKGAFSQYFFDNFKPGGGTRLYDTVGEVIGRVAAEAGQYRQINVIILSDGDDSTMMRRYRNWAALCELINQLKIDSKTTSFSWYTLGYDPKDKPPPGCMIKHFSVPDPSQVKIAEPPPAADFTASPTKVKVNEPVLFVLDKEAGVSKARWSFGDGTTSTEMKPRHVFQRKGKFDVTVLVEGPGGKAESKSGACVVEVLEEVPLEARFKWSPRVVRVGEEVTLVDESLGSPTAWQWKVPGIGTKSEHNPTVVFRQVGPAQVELIASKEGKSSSATLAMDVLPQPPDARFSVEPMEPEVGTLLRLKANTADKAYRHRWTIADVTLPEEKAEVEWKVDRGGRIEILHAVEGPGGLTEKDITVFAADALSAKFSWSPSSPHAGQTVSFRDESTGGPTTWTWEIQGVGKKSERHPTIEFAVEGEFAVKLTVEKNGRTPSFLTRPIKVGPKLIKPDASFVATPRIFTVGTKIQLTASQDHPGWKHEWTIDQTHTFSGPKVEWTGTRTGEIPVVHRVITAQGTDEKTETLLGKTDIPLAKFTASPLSGRTPLSVQFTNESSGEIVSYAWDFGDGEASTEKDPVHAYKLDGASKQTFTPTLTVKNRAGEISKNTEPVTITVTPPPPWWKIPASIGGVALLIALIVWLVIRNPLRPPYGTLRWDYRGQSGKKSLTDCGMTIDLADLGIKEWKVSQGLHIIQNRKRDGMHVKRTGDEPILLADKTKFKLEGVDFEYRES